MVKSPVSVAFIVSVVAGCASFLAGCGEGEVPKAEVEKNAMATLSAQVGKPSPQITCPGNLKAKAGTTMTCTMPIDGKTYDVKISVTGVEGSNAKFDVEVAKEPHA